MIEVKDEILNGEPKYEIRDVDGNVIYTGISIEMITPLLQEGTPLNSKLFESFLEEIDQNLKELSRIDRYNIPTIPGSTGAVEDERNLLEGTWTPESYGAFTAINGEMEVTVPDHSTEEHSVVELFSSTGWISDSDRKVEVIIDFSTPRHIKAFEMGLHINNTSYFGTFSISGSNNETAWTTLYETTTYQSGVTEYNLTRHDNYRYYKLMFSNTTTVRCGIRELKVASYYARANKIFFDNNIKEYFENMRFLMAIPENSLTHDRVLIDINDLGQKDVNGIINSGKKYELVYNGNAFNAREIV